MKPPFSTLPLREGRSAKRFGEGCVRQRARFARDPSPKNPLPPLRDAPGFFDPPSRGGWNYGEMS
jgi:hypothetical protein